MRRVFCLWLSFCVLELALQAQEAGTQRNLMPDGFSLLGKVAVKKDESRHLFVPYSKYGQEKPLALVIRNLEAFNLVAGYLPKGERDLVGQFGKRIVFKDDKQVAIAVFGGRSLVPYQVIVEDIYSLKSKEEGKVRQLVLGVRLYNNHPYKEKLKEPANGFYHSPCDVIVLDQTSLKDVSLSSTESVNLLLRRDFYDDRLVTRSELSDLR